jgi:hypothetical protein
MRRLVYEAAQIVDDSEPVDRQPVASAGAGAAKLARHDVLSETIQPVELSSEHGDTAVTLRPLGHQFPPIQEPSAYAVGEGCGIRRPPIATTPTALH